MRRRGIVPVLALALIAGCDGGGGAGEEDGGGDVTEAPPDDGRPPYPPERGVEPGASEDQLRALERANYYRWYAGLPPLDMLQSINQAAQAHCDCYAQHADQYGSMSPHSEGPWGPPCYGDLMQRMMHWGYAGMGFAEVMAFMHNPEGAVDGWMDTLYHRIPFMDASYNSCGYGLAGAGTAWTGGNACDTMDFGTVDVDGRSFQGPELEGLWPPPGSTGIRTSFDGMESPTPIAPPGGFPSGTIVTITWSSGFSAKIHEHAFWKEGEEDAPRPHVFADSSNDPSIGTNTVALYAHKPLENGTTYWVRLAGEKGGLPYERTWSFTTARGN
ncbi:MAG: CAP domain-containing protein [Deltaproteobacteria bacterium]|nr:CAP domain-containing protein [Deltaproteobacteria bacterium]